MTGVSEWYRSFRGADRKTGFKIPNVTDNCIFVHIPKNAGTSIADALGLKRSAHRTAREYRNMIGTFSYGRRYSFAFARNPWSRFLSLYRYARLQVSRHHSATDPESARWGKHADYDLLAEASLDECARYLLEGRLQHDKTDINHWRPQVDWVTDEKGGLMVDFVGRVETVDEGFRVVAERLGLERDTLSVANPSRDRRQDPHSYREAYSDTAGAIVADYYRDDIDTFGYTF